ncbi:MAG: hypothetical protein ACI85Q_000802 [Salibacteraceae bacterium]|jgi:hypothetical protein
MAKIDSSTLLTDLKKRTEFCLKEAKKLRKQKEESLNFKPTPETWSKLQCIAHLNTYADFYVDEIKQAIENSKKASVPLFKPGFMGNVFSKAMMPKKKTTMMQSPSNMEPAKGELTKDILNVFIHRQKEYLEILELAKDKNLNKSSIKVTISRWVKINLGDALRINVYHNERHILQAIKTVKAT